MRRDRTGPNAICCPSIDWVIPGQGDYDRRALVGVDRHIGLRWFPMTVLPDGRPICRPARSHYSPTLPAPSTLRLGENKCRLHRRALAAGDGQYRSRRVVVEVQRSRRACTDRRASPTPPDTTVTPSAITVTAKRMRIGPSQSSASLHLVFAKMVPQLTSPVITSPPR